MFWGGVLMVLYVWEYFGCGLTEESLYKYTNTQKHNHLLKIEITFDTSNYHILNGYIKNSFLIFFHIQLFILKTKTIRNSGACWCAGVSAQNTTWPGSPRGIAS